MTTIVAAFPGTGKTWATKVIQTINEDMSLNCDIADLSIDDFKYLDKDHHIKNRNCKGNYIRKIKYLTDQKYPLIFIDVDKDIMNYLNELANVRTDIKLVLIIPDYNDIDIYRNIYKSMNYSSAKYHDIIDNWSEVLDGIFQYFIHSNFTINVLKRNKHITDYLKIVIDPKIENDTLYVNKYIKFDLG